MKSRFTGTGLDSLIGIIETDVGIKRKISAPEIDAGAQAAGELNHLIVDGIRELGLANDGAIDAADLRGLGDWVRASSARNQTYLELYGAERNGAETGFQLVENEDSSARLFGKDAVDEVASAIYSFGFGDRNGRLLDVDGDLYRSVILTASWLDKLLTDADMEALSNPGGSLVVEGTTGTGLDQLVDIIQTDPGLIRNVSRTDIAEGARAADGMNNMYLDGMKALGLANDGAIDRSDVTAIDAWIREDAGRHAEFLDLHESYHLVLHKGADIAQIAEVDDGIHPHVGHVINHGMKGLYQVGLGVEKGRMLDDDGVPHISTGVPADWLDQLLTDADMAALGNPDIDTSGTTGTGLDQLVDVIQTDPGLIRNVSRADIDEAARAADGMNQMIVEAIDTLGLADDGKISSDDVKEISSHIQASDARADQFEFLYGEDKNGVETGFQLVLGDGGTDKMFGRHAVNTAADVVFHVGFEVESNRFHDADGDLSSYSVYRAADYIDDLYFA
ncbi:hypothetical protein [Pikeienuella sp. HZG-20]|uniref:hypothetical protein n=1 Tax=Paludibacillus litoralis TaxID=3133267 RepID=UPI0030ECE607